MAGQLRHVLEAMSLPSTSFGIIPASVSRPMWAVEGLTIYDTTQVHVELLTANVTITSPTELTSYFRAFDELSSMAVYGDKARELITQALDTFRSA